MAGRVRVDSPLRTSRSQARGPEPARARDVDRLPLRELTGWEEEYLERHQHDANTARTCNEVLAMCCVPPGTEPGESQRAAVRALLVAERDRELVRLRTMSIGPGVDATVACPSCGQTNEVFFSLNSLDLDLALPEARSGIALPDLEGFTVDLPTAADQQDLLDAAVAGAAERRTWLLGRCVRDADGDPLGPDAARALPVGRRAALERAVDEAVPTLDLDMALSCVHCETDFTAPFDVAVFFFRPDRTCAPVAAGRAPTRARLPLVRGRHLAAAAAPPARVPDGAGGRRRRVPAGRPDSARRVLMRTVRAPR